RPRSRRVRGDDHVRRQPAAGHADAAPRDLRRVRPELRRDARDGRGAGPRQRHPARGPAHCTDVAALTLDSINVPLRSFALELTLDVDATVAVVGPSGAGKSTILRAVAGLVKPRAGRIVVDGNVWFDAARRVDLAPDEREVGLVFQGYALFPHMTVRKNVEYARKRRAGELLERFGIAALADVRPSQLSGGGRQRGALARALAGEPRVLLLDEPISALDAHTKVSIRAELHELLTGLEIPSLLVTHDFEDAAALAD